MVTLTKYPRNSLHISCICELFYEKVFRYMVSEPLSTHTYLHTQKTRIFANEVDSFKNYVERAKCFVPIWGLPSSNSNNHYITLYGKADSSKTSAKGPLFVFKGSQLWQPLSPEIRSGYLLSIWYSVALATTILVHATGTLHLVLWWGSYGWSASIQPENPPCSPTLA